MLRTFFAPRVPTGRSGFSLVEAAIVLGVVGLVVGGIYLTATTVRNRHRLDETYNGVLSGIVAIQNSISPTMTAALMSQAGS